MSNLEKGSKKSIFKYLGTEDEIHTEQLKQYFFILNRDVSSAA